MNKHQMAGRTVMLRGGSQYIIEDWWINVFGKSWTTARGNPAAVKYAVRVIQQSLPMDDLVLYGKSVHGLGDLFHESEIMEVM